MPAKVESGSDPDVEVAKIPSTSQTAFEKTFSEESGSSPTGSPSKRGKGHERHLGVYHGVVIPVCENMWGIIIFLRFFYIVGNAGIGQSLLILLICLLSAVLTALSLGAVASNGPIEKSGTYFLVSRALGPRIGGPVGLAYYVGLTLLASLEAIGGVQLLLFTFPALKFESWATLPITAGALILLSSLVPLGMRTITTFSSISFSITILSMLSVFIGFGGARPPPVGITGLSWETFRNNFGPGYRNGVTFPVAIGIMYPCFAGILGGADRARSLKNPAKAIPKGTLGAVLLSGALYAMFFLFWGAVAERQYLRGEFVTVKGGGKAKLAQVLNEIVWPLPPLTNVGIVISCFSLALQCLLTAPEVLQAIAADGSIPFLFPLARLHAGVPLAALTTTSVLSIAVSMSNSVDLIAAIVSISFLTCYAALNFSCFIFAVIKPPSWRPTWRFFHWSAALLGFLTCVALMFVVQWYWALASILILFGIYAYIDYKQVTVDWGTGLGGVRLHLALQSILSLGHEARFSVNWRPQLLCLTKPEMYWESEGHHGKHLLALASQLKKGRGLCVVTVILEGELAEMGEEARVEQRLLEERMEKEGVVGFARAMVAPTYREGKKHAIQCTGIGALEPNTLLLGWPKWKEPGHETAGEVLLETLAECHAANKAVVLAMNLGYFPVQGEKQEGFIDIWWVVHDGGLLLLLGHLLQQHKIWRQCQLRVHTVADELADPTAAKASLRQLIAEVRIKAEVDVVELEDADLAPYTYDYTLREEEARAYQQEIRARRSSSKHFEAAKSQGRISLQQPASYDVLEDAEKKEDPPPLQRQQSFLSEVALVHGFAHTRRSTQVSDTTESQSGTATEAPSPSSTPRSASPMTARSLSRTYLPSRLSSIATRTEAIVPIPSQSRTRDEEAEEEEEEEQNSLGVGSRPEIKESTLHRRVIGNGANEDGSSKAELGLPMHQYSYGEQCSDKRRSTDGSAAGSMADRQMCHIRRTWNTFASTFTAEKLNRQIKEKSGEGRLVIINLPGPYRGMDPKVYMEYCEALTQGLTRVLLVYGTGKEIWHKPIVPTQDPRNEW